ncbi:MAG: HAMP domain-containing histidine kinase [Gammaproteobacteria bacterium]|nr:HAMP domain-containing histidine kinase [Gammaproteobacteria bacterium]
MTKSTEKLDFETILASSIHDMKNSLGMLLNSLDELVSSLDGRDSARSGKLTTLQLEAKRVNNNLIQLLALYRMGSGKYAVNISDHYMTDFFGEALVEFYPLLENSGVQLEMDCPEDLQWFFDENLLMVVITNILNNISRYTRDRVRVSAGEKDGWLVIQIDDNGDGYPEQLLDLPGRIISGVDIQTGSTGLGLYFSATAARTHTCRGREGFISLSNSGTLGGGCFSLHLP